MSSFTDPLYVEVTQGEVNGRGLFKTLYDFEYHVGYLGSEERILIPSGFETDFLSIPSIGRMFIPITGKASKAALLHDWMWTQGWSKSKSARIFLEALLVLKVPMWRCLLCYLSVRFYWKKT